MLLLDGFGQAFGGQMVGRVHYLVPSLGSPPLNRRSQIIHDLRGGHAVAYTAKMVARALSDSDSNWRRDPPTQMPSTFESWRVWASELEAE